MRGVCIVTGGAGFIGCAVSPYLAARFERVIAFDNLHPQIHPQRTRPAALHPAVELVVGDVTSAADWDRLLAGSGCEVVLHLAAETGTGQSLTEATRHAQVNVNGTAVMLDGLARAGRMPARIVLTSSRAVYGEGAWQTADETPTYPGQRTREQLAAGVWDFPGLAATPSSAAVTRPAPVSVYGATKLAQEHMISAWATAFGVEVATLRLQNVYGVGQSLSNPYTGIVPLFCRLARQGESIPLYEDGEMLRDFVLIEDVAAAIIAAVDAPRTADLPLDIGTGTPTSIADLARAVAAHYGAPAPHVCAKYRYGDVRHASCRIDDSTARLDWRPRHDLRSGLGLLCPWVDSSLAQEAR